MEISNFLNEQYSDSALYIAYRALPSYIDGQKNSSRKFIYTIKKENIKKEVKVSEFASKIVSNAGYLHGDSSGQSTCVTMARSFCGSNNLPVLEGVGSFGTRHINEAASPRYIFAKPAEYFDVLFKKEDDDNLISQEFEGKEIEPMFYVPTIPLLLVNGSSGIGVGFASTILPRKVENIIKAVKLALTEKKIPAELFDPYWNGFTGKVIYLSDNKWEVRGHISEIRKKTVVIDELPISCDLAGYIAFLKKIKEKGIITKFVDYSEDDKFKFEVTFNELPSSEEDIMKELKLTETITENLTCIDENNAIREFNCIDEIFYNYFSIKIEYFKKRIRSQIAKLLKEEEMLDEIYRFIEKVIKNEIDIKIKKSELEAILKKEGFVNIEKLLSMPIYSLTEDKAEEIHRRWVDKKEELRSMKKETPITQWLKDIDQLERIIGGK